ncbi:MAG: right-handed parallel beta-helix repeat-containing protein, partial [Sedimentisphaerales bacterium]|nr:right-handed parallel beta-helix repeat-containing protein [Sedimentisphaerales bacterium]
MANKKQIHHSHRFYLPFLLIACLIGPSLASAATYYLDAVNGNDGNPGTSEQPWQTLAKARSSVTGGDTVIMADGDYGDWSQINGTLYDDWVTFQAADGDEVSVDRILCIGDTANTAYIKIDGLIITQDGTYGYCIKVSGFDHWEFTNLTLIGDGYVLSDVVGYANGIGIQIYDTANNIDINNCTIRGTGVSSLSGFVTGIHIKANNVSITNSDISDCYTGISIDQSVGVEVIDSAIHNIASDNIALGGVNDILIQGNDVYDLEVYKPTLAETPTDTVFAANGLSMTNNNALWNTAGDTFAAATELVVISGNNVKVNQDNVYVTIVSDTEITLSKTIADGGTPSNVNYYFRGLAHTDLMQANAPTTQSDNVTVRGNKFYNSDHQLVWLNPALAPSYTEAAGHNWLIENNLFYNTYTSATDEQTGTVRVSAIDGLIFRNNIVIGTLELARHSSNYTIAGNIISKAENWGNYGAIVAEGHNIINRADTDFDFADTTGFLDGDWNNPAFFALFVDSANGDFRHASASSLGVGHGDPANYPISDILGVYRSIPPDAGCYEYGGTPSQPLISISDQSITEADSGTADVAFTVSLSAAGDEIVTVNYTTANGTATTADGDYVAVSDTLSFPIGTTERTITVSVNGDTNIEPDETFHINLSNPANATIADNQGECIIVNDDSPGPGDEPVGHWHFSEAAGDSAADSSGQGNTGTLVNTPAVDWIPGGGAVQFDGTNGAVQIPTDDLSAGHGTVALWAKAEDVSGSYYLFGHAIGSWSDRIQLYINEGFLNLGLGDSHAVGANIESISLNTWYHITLTWNGTNYVVYVNGTPRANGTYTGLASLNTFADIGNTGNPDWRDESFNGLIDDVRIYNRVLSAGEVSTLCSANHPPTAATGTDTDPEEDQVHFEGAAS